MKCENCGREYVGSFCPDCGKNTNKNELNKTAETKNVKRELTDEEVKEITQTFVKGVKKNLAFRSWVMTIFASLFGIILMISKSPFGGILVIFGGILFCPKILRKVGTASKFAIIAFAIFLFVVGVAMCR